MSSRDEADCSCDRGPQPAGHGFERVQRPVREAAAREAAIQDQGDQDEPEVLNPTWDQEFSFLVGDVRDVLKLDVYDEDILRMDDFLGQLRVPLEDVLAAEDLSLGTQWYQLLPKGKTDKAIDCGN